MTVGENMKAIRIGKGFTQKQVAERSGMADSAIRKYESGKVHPKMTTLFQIAKALEVDLSVLTNGDPYYPITEGTYAMINILESIGKLDQNQLQLVAKHIDPVILDDTVDPEWAQLHEKFNNSTITREELNRYVEIIRQTANGAGDRMEKAMMLLNPAGKQEAVKRVEELTEIPKYQLTPGKSVITASEPTEADHHVTTAPDSETPSESKETPPQADAQDGEE